jgi:TonB-dependent SusC/RagA subfamily outer membrane receptor
MSASQRREEVPMELIRPRLSLGFLASAVVLLLLATGCSQYGVGSGRPDSDVLEGDDVTIPIRTMERFIANRLPGIVVRGNSIVIRGISSFSSTNEALIMVDGREMDTGTFLNMNPEEVEKIEALRGADAAIYGRRGANGVLVVTTH